MITLNQAAYNILNQLRGGRSSNNEYISLSQIKFWIKYYRALLIRRDEERFSRVEGLAQSIVVPIAASNVSWGTPAQTNPPASSVPEYTAISASVLPNIVRLKDRPAIMQVLVDGTRQVIPYIDSRRGIWNQFDKYTSLSRRCWLYGGKLYINNWNLTGAVSPQVELTAIFEDPEQAYNFNLSGDPWDDDTNDFPISSDLLQQVSQSVINGEGQIIAQTMSDRTLDNLPDRQAE